MGVLLQFLDAEPGSRAHRLLHNGSLADDTLVNFFSYALDLSSLEKQALLEEKSMYDRAQRLIDVVEFCIEEARLSSDQPESFQRH